MWHVIVIILKIIGIGLLLLLGLLLLALLAFLFVPVRYDAWGKSQGDIEGRLRITWLLHAVSVPVIYRRGQLTVKVKLLGIPIMRIPDPPDKPAKDKDQGEDGIGKDQGEDTEKAERIPASRRGADAKDPGTGTEEWGEGLSEPGESVQDRTQERAKDQEALLTAESPAEADEKPREMAALSGTRELTVKEKEIPKKKRFFLLDILARIWEKLKKLQYTIRLFCAKIREGRQRLQELREFLTLDSTRAALKLCKGQMFYLLKKLGPKKVRGWVHFGTGDPAQTGEILGGISALYALWPCRLELQPDFQQKVLEGEIRIKGRLRMCTLVGIAWRLWRDKNMKVVYKRIREIARGRK